MTDSAIPCDKEVFKRGKPLLLADTGAAGGNLLLEHWVKRVAERSGERVDWHYSGGVAQVLVLGDMDAVTRAARELAAQLPEQITIMRWCVPTDEGLYRAGVTAVPDGTIAGFMDPVTGKAAFIVEGSD